VADTIVRQLAAGAPSKRVGEKDSHVEGLFFGPLSPRLVLIWMLSGMLDWHVYIGLLVER
jgi:hypothetical protein